METRRVAVVAGGTSKKWGAFPGTYRDLVSEAAKELFDSTPGLSPGDIEGFIASSVMPERSVFQSHVATLMAETVGVSPRKLFQRVENMCGSGTVAIRNAYAAIACGLADVILVVGAEKMHTPDPGEMALNMLVGVDREWEGAIGVTAPVQFALTAQSHMARFGTTVEDLAAVSAKNHTHAVGNPYAQFPKKCSITDVRMSKPIATPFTVFDCSGIADGSAAVVLASADRARAYTDTPMFLLGTGQVASGFNYANVHKDWWEWPALGQAVRDAYAMAGVGPTDVDVAEVHDCFSISEIIVYEEMGWAEKGSGGAFVSEGRSTYGGDLVVNPRGGLLGCGHPLGATGVAQAVEIFRQLSGQAGPRQVPGAKIGLTHNLSGISEHHVVIYGTEEAL